MTDRSLETLEDKLRSLQKTEMLLGALLSSAEMREHRAKQEQEDLKSILQSTREIILSLAAEHRKLRESDEDTDS